MRCCHARLSVATTLLTHSRNRLVADDADPERVKRAEGVDPTLLACGAAKKSIFDDDVRSSSSHARNARHPGVLDRRELGRHENYPVGDGQPRGALFRTERIDEGVNIESKPTRPQLLLQRHRYGCLAATRSTVHHDDLPHREIIHTPLLSNGNDDPAHLAYRRHLITPDSFEAAAFQNRRYLARLALDNGSLVRCSSLRPIEPSYAHESGSAVGWEAIDGANHAL